jgi:hypothetical protein
MQGVVAVGCTCMGKQSLWVGQPLWACYALRIRMSMLQYNNLTTMLADSLID